jgi:AraC-like DNA-binding protein
MHKYAIKPRRELQVYIERYWGWESADDVRLPKLLPGTGAELIFHYGAPFIVASPGDDTDSSYSASSAHLLCVRSRPYCLRACVPLGFLAVRFRAGAFRHFCQISLEELNDSTCGLGDIWGKAGEKLAQRIGDASTLQSRIDHLESYLLDCFSRYAQTNAYIDIALNQLYYHHNVVQIESLAKQMRISRRHFERTFKIAVGVGPKLFQRLSRFQQTVRDLLLANETSYLPIALDHGYYDQSHFIKEFHDFAQDTPSSFLQPATFLSHFYNKSMPLLR